MPLAQLPVSVGGILRCSHVVPRMAGMPAAVSIPSCRLLPRSPVVQWQLQQQCHYSLHHHHKQRQQQQRGRSAVRSVSTCATTSTSAGPPPQAAAEAEAGPAPAGMGAGSAAASAGAAIPRMVSIAGSDSGAGAGIQADVKAAVARGVWCSTVVTALTAQNTLGVQRVLPTPAAFVGQQMRSVLSDIGADAIKTGMLPNADVVETVCSLLKDLNVLHVPLVVDPVLVATSGDSLTDDSVLTAFRQQLIPMASVLTPNLREAEALLGLQCGSITSVADMRHLAVQLLHELKPRAVLLKGGHLPETEAAVDVLCDGTEVVEVVRPRVPTANAHGTGCTLASALAAELAKGLPLRDAVEAAKDYITSVMVASATASLGTGPQGPLNHVPQLNSWGAEQQRGKAKAGTRGGAAFDVRMLRLYAVTDSRMNAVWGRPLAEAVEGAIRGGATIVQIREKDLDTGAFLEEAAKALAVARRHGVPLVVNDRVDVALACGADGVHVGQSDMPARAVRRLLGPGKIVGVSAKTREQATAAWEEGADYVGVGGVFPTTTKENNRTIGVEGLRDVCAAALLPVVAIGGIGRSGIREVLGEPGSEAAASRPGSLAGVAVVSAMFNQEDVEVASRALRDEVDRCFGEVGDDVARSVRGG